jgi:DNA-binding XRE family transcriptional regulator
MTQRSEAFERNEGRGFSVGAGPKNAPRPPRNRLEMIDHPASNFARWRAIMGLTQGDVADKFGVSMVTVSSWDKGKTRPKAVVRIAMLKLLSPSLQGEWPE